MELAPGYCYRYFATRGAATAGEILGSRGQPLKDRSSQGQDKSGQKGRDQTVIALQPILTADSGGLGEDRFFRLLVDNLAQSISP